MNCFNRSSCCPLGSSWLSHRSILVLVVLGLLQLSDTVLASPATDQIQPPQQAARETLTMIDLAQSQGDTSYYGYARGKIAPWWNLNGQPQEPSQGQPQRLSEENLPPDLLLARAILRQQQHQFQMALNDLQPLITQGYAEVQARLIRANIYLAMGQPNKAQRDCQAIALLTDPLVTANCMAQARLGMRPPQPVINSLQQLIANQHQVSTELLVEIWITLGQLQRSNRQYQQALESYSQALRLQPRHPFLLVQYCSLLIHLGELETLAAYFEQPPQSNELWIYWTYARLARSIEISVQERADLNQTMDFIKQASQDHPQVKTLTLYYYLLKPESSLMLKFAQENWQQQKSPEDAHLVLQALKQQYSFNPENAPQQPTHQKIYQQISSWIRTHQPQNQELISMLTELEQY